MGRVRGHLGIFGCDGFGSCDENLRNFLNTRFLEDYEK